jgi:serine/threonine protein kinase
MTRRGDASSIRPMSPAATVSVPPGVAAAASEWSLLPHDVIAPGRSVVRRLAGGGGHEAFLVELAGRRGYAVAKLPRPGFVDDAHRLLRLRNEGRALGLLAHPTVPRHLDTVLGGPYPHLLLEHVPGPTLHDAIAEKQPPPPALVASLGCAIAGALAHIAAAGWVHLDVKPSNIVLNARPRLIDFELARPAAEAARMTLPTGTWAYMPPEQRRAGFTRAGTVGPPADVFALAASLHEALVGRPLDRPWIPDAATLRGRLGAVLCEALSPSPSDRPTAVELADALEPWAGEAAAAQDAGTGMRAATVVPTPGGLFTCSSPSIAATRS